MKNPTKVAQFHAETHSFAGQSPKVSTPKPKYEGTGPENWQSKAFIHNTCIPEVYFSNKLVSSNLSRGKLRVLEMKETKRGGINYAPTRNTKVIKLLQNLTGPFGNHSALLYSFAHNLMIAGECYLVGKPFRVKGKIVKMDWEVMSVKQLIKTKDYAGNEKVFVVDKMGAKTELPSDAYYARCWSPDPEFTDAADSPMKHNTELCEETILLTQLIAVLAKSRMNAGMIALADELSFGSADETLDEVSEDEVAMDPLSREFLNQTTATLEDPFDVSAFTPMLMRGPKEFLPTKDNYITFERPLDELILRLREDAIVRIVRGMDLPSELVTGKGETNSWSGFGIDQDFITKHLEPLGILIGNFLTRKYLRPFLIENGMDWEEAEKYVVSFDSSEISTKPDMTKTAIELYDRNAIGEDALRRLSGVEEADSPSTEEFIRQVVLNLSKLSAPIATVLLPLLPEFQSFKDDLQKAVATPNTGPAGADSNSKTPPPQTPGAQDTRGNIPKDRKNNPNNSEVK